MRCQKGVRKFDCSTMGTYLELGRLVQIKESMLDDEEWIIGPCLNYQTSSLKYSAPNKIVSLFLSKYVKPIIDLSFICQLNFLGMMC